MAYSIDSVKDNCYPGTTVLINKYDIREQSKLDAVESVIVTARAEEWLAFPKSASFDFAHYKRIHSFLFGDLYEWAGEIRTTDISKKGTQFCPCSDISHKADAAFKYINENKLYTGLEKSDLVDGIVDFYCVSNYLHPFREGNGRTQRIFISQLIRNAGYDIYFNDIDPDALMIATIQSANGITDFLKKIFNDSIIDSHQH